MPPRRIPPDRDRDEPAHDVLAAEEFAVPAPDPALHSEPPHDVLAAEEFGVPAPDPNLHPGPVRLPHDPTGIAEPHDVLAAEEFAMPAPTRSAAVSTAPSLGPGHDQRSSRVAWVVAAALALGVLRLRRRR